MFWIGVLVGLLVGAPLGVLLLAFVIGGKNK